MAATFRFSHHPNRAHEINWREWGAAALQEAGGGDLPIFLNISAVWCRWCHMMDETTLSDSDVIELLRSRFLAIRVDADRYPHVQDRYIAGGWPTNAFLTPTGEVLWAGTYTEAEPMLQVARGVLTAWRERREELQLEVERRRRALESARKRHTTGGLVRREAADDVLAAARDSFDARHGGFGGEPKFPTPRAIELLCVQSRTGDPAWSEMAHRTLDGMLSGELIDRAEGGFYRYALAEDWTSPRLEKLLDVNAALLSAYALGAHLSGRADWRQAAERTVRWCDDVLGLDEGLWAGSQYPDDEYFELDAVARAGREPPPVDGTVYTSWNAQWIAALADAGGRLSRDEWIASAAAAVDRLVETMAGPEGLMHHYRPRGEEPALPILLVDALYTAIASMAVWQAAGGARHLQRAREIARTMEKSFWADDGGFWDRCRSPHDVGVLRYRDRPFESNADAARFLLDLALATGERKYRALAERTLAMLSPRAGRHGVDGSCFALAVEEFFDPPARVVLVERAEGAGAELRRAALRLAVPGRRVLTVANGDQIGNLRFLTDADAAAFVCGARGSSAAITRPEQIGEAVDAVV